MGVIENLAILHWIFPLFLIPDGVGVGLEIDRAACVLHVFEDVSNGAFVPAILILWGLMRCFSALPLLVGSGVQHLLLFQQGGDLARPFSLHAERKDPLHDLCSFLVNHPFLGIVRVTLDNIHAELHKLFDVVAERARVGGDVIFFQIGRYMIYFRYLADIALLIFYYIYNHTVVH